MQVKIDTTIVFQLWKNKEKALGEPLKLTDAAQITQLAPETIRKIREGKTTRFDAPVIAKLCQLLDVPPGPVPFIIYEYENENEAAQNTAAKSIYAPGSQDTPTQTSRLSELGQKLTVIRERAMAAGMQTQSQDEIAQELAERRGERQ